MRHIDLAALNNLILDCIFQQCSIQEMFNRVYESVHLPFNYFDTAFRLVANALPRPFPYEPWENMAENGGASNEEIVGKNYLMSQERMYSAGKSILFREAMNDLDQFPQACGPVISNGILLGYMGTMVEDAYPEDAIRVNDMMIRGIAILSTTENHNGAIENLRLERFLTGQPVSSRELAAFESRYPPPYAIIVIHSPKPATSTLHYINFLMSQTDHNLLGAVYSEDTMYFLHYRLSQDSLKRLSSALKSLTDLFAVSCGLSDQFFSLYELRKGIWQAELAIAVGYQVSGDEKIHFFRALYREILALQILETSAESFLHPMLAQLISTDADRSDSLLETLQSYLDFQGRVSEIAESLSIHKNTVDQRLHKIESLTGFCLKEPSCLDSLEIQLLLNRFRQTLRTAREA